MQWEAPTPTLKIALGHGRFTGEPGGGDWTDLSDRITDQGWVVDLCGRDSVRDDFRPGGLTVLLKNNDRMLDPSNPDGWVYAPDGQGLPGAPVTLDLTYDGDTERRFTGYLASPAWAGSGSRLGTGYVMLTARDALDWSGDLPDSTWTAATLALWPDWYLPMDPENAVLDTGSEIPDRSGTTTAHATVTSPDSALSRPDGQPGGWAPWLKIPPDSYFTSAQADLMPGSPGDSLNVTVSLWWKSIGNHTSGQESVVARMVDPGSGPGGTPRWEVIVDDAGDAQITTYDAGGTLIDSDTISLPGGRWDDGAPHFVVIRFTSGNTMKVWFGGYTATLTATATVYESDLINGPSDVVTWIDEVTVWRGGSPNRASGALTDDEVAGLLLEAGGYIGQRFGDDYVNRLAFWLEAAGIPANSDYITRMRVPADDTTEEGFVSLNVATMPQNVADAYRQTVGPGGSVVVDRFGFPVARDVTALTSGDYDPEYVDTSAHFTDEDATLTGVQLRHAGVRRSAVDEGSVINRVESTFWYLIGLGPPVDLQQMTFRPEDDTVLDGRTSKQQFGGRTHTESVDRYGWANSASRAQALLARHAWPVAGFESIELDAMRKDDLCAWLMTAEPELAIDVTYKPGPDVDPITVTGLNLQGLRIEGTSYTLTATARVFKS